MRYGFYLPTRGQTATPEALEALVQRGEALGFSSVMIADHIVFPVTINSKYPDTVSGAFPGQGDALEQLALMAFIAGKTRTLRLVTERHDRAPPESRGHRQDARHHRRALEGSRHGRRRRGLVARGVPGSRRAGFRSPRLGQRRVHPHHEDALDGVPRLLRGPLLSLRRRALPAYARAEAAPADLGRRPQPGRPSARRAPRRRLASRGRESRRAAPSFRAGRESRGATTPHGGGGT